MQIFSQRINIRFIHLPELGQLLARVAPFAEPQAAGYQGGAQVFQLGQGKTVILRWKRRPPEDDREVYHGVPGNGKSEFGLPFTGPSKPAMMSAQVSRIAVRAPSQDWLSCCERKKASMG